MSGKLNTKDVKGFGGGQSKTLEPGNVACKINGVALDESKFKVGAYNLTLYLEGPDLGAGFEGFFINKDNEALGRHKGAVSKVRAGKWPFADSLTKGGVEILRDNEILKFIKTLCAALGTVNWLDDQSGKHDTIEALITAFNTDQPFKDKFINYCIAGKEYKDKGGYTKYDLYLPKFSKDGAPFEALNAKPSKLQKYNNSVHLEKLKVNEISEFGSGSDNPLSEDQQADFQL